MTCEVRSQATQAAGGLAGFQSSTAGRDGAPSGGAPGPRARPPGSHGSLPGQLRHVARIQQCGAGHAGARLTPSRRHRHRSSRGIYTAAYCPGHAVTSAVVRKPDAL